MSSRPRWQVNGTKVTDEQLNQWLNFSTIKFVREEGQGRVARILLVLINDSDHVIEWKLRSNTTTMTVILHELLIVYLFNFVSTPPLQRVQHTGGTVARAFSDTCFERDRVWACTGKSVQRFREFLQLWCLALNTTILSNSSKLKAFPTGSGQIASHGEGKCLLVWICPDHFNAWHQMEPTKLLFSLNQITDDGKIVGSTNIKFLGCQFLAYKTSTLKAICESVIICTGFVYQSLNGTCWPFLKS